MVNIVGFLYITNIKTKITDSPDCLVDGLLGLVSARCLLGLLGEVGHHVTDTGGGGVSGH